MEGTCFATKGAFRAIRASDDVNPDSALPMEHWSALFLTEDTQVDYIRHDDKTFTKPWKVLPCISSIRNRLRCTSDRVHRNGSADVGAYRPHDMGSNERLLGHCNRHFKYPIRPSW